MAPSIPYIFLTTSFLLGMTPAIFCQNFEHYKGTFGAYAQVWLTLRQEEARWEGSISYLNLDSVRQTHTLVGQVSANGKFFLEELDKLGNQRLVRWEGERKINKITGIWHNAKSHQKFYYALERYQPPRLPDHIDSIQKTTLEEFGLRIPRDYIFTDYLGFPVGVPTRYEVLLDSLEAEVVAFPSVKEKGVYLYLRPEAFRSLRRMQRMVDEGINLGVSVAFRGIQEQEKLYKKYGSSHTERAGYSEHHLATSVHFYRLQENSSAFLWLLQNAFNYGWIPSFYFRKQTYLIPQPEHWRYVGKTTALAFHEVWKKEIQAKIKQLEE